MAELRNRADRIRPLRLAVVGVLASALLVGCSSIGLGALDRDGADEVALLAQKISDERPDDINGFARAAAARLDSGHQTEGVGIRLIGIEPIAPDTINDPLGRLTFLAYLPATGVTSSDSAPGQNCFDVEFDYYGYTGDWGLAGSRDPAIVGVECPADPVSVVPPRDTSEHPVVAENASAVFSEVLAAIPPDASPDGDQLADEIRARLTPPSGEFEVTAEVSVLVRGTDIGVATGGRDDCVLFARRAGVVQQLHVPSVLLQPGEYGCRASTALLDGDQLKSPH